VARPLDGKKAALFEKKTQKTLRGLAIATG